ncbi:hypothetical protein PPL_06837 [Heterostelium album PN500]|uniref:Serine protease n=1 Tax=Heterostelium pallidum (strain ATCC 26659 / Pp 5 / PN500) TaxID=670386 RepID=D3BDN5_HETP5|nr:hypothetical protein PPL_06837 [Heterostelium album PN500]EFA80016.1 hypothetical protein PPL_06837 [Heterostelium album PN500]|eukprot:XP_020432136.1 hypothetical protein PPL_06837 [Heterostelium album PN500]
MVFTNIHALLLGLAALGPILLGPLMSDMHEMGPILLTSGMSTTPCIGSTCVRSTTSTGSIWMGSNSTMSTNVESTSIESTRENFDHPWRLDGGKSLEPGCYYTFNEGIGPVVHTHQALTNFQKIEKTFNYEIRENMNNVVKNWKIYNIGNTFKIEGDLIGSLKTGQRAEITCTTNNKKSLMVIVRRPTHKYVTIKDIDSFSDVLSFQYILTFCCWFGRKSDIKESKDYEDIIQPVRLGRTAESSSLKEKEDETKSDDVKPVRSTTITLDSHSKIIGRRDLQYKETYENTSSAVGRIFVSFKVREEEYPVWCSGTGFCVKNDLVMTAGHVLAYPVNPNDPIETQEMQRNMKYEKIYIFFGPDATITSEIDLTNIDKEIMYELESCGRDFDQSFKDPLVFSGSNDQRYLWPTHNDLEVLRFKGTPPTDINILFPMIPTNDQEIEHYVMGYPGYIDLTKFLSDYKGTNDQDLEALYINVRKESRGFQRKTIFIGKVDNFKDNGITHSCPTLKGTAGGILAISQHERKFVGVHLGGTQETGKIALSVTHPLFWHLYRTFVLDDQFIQDNLVQLESYLNHIKDTSSRSISLIDERVFSAEGHHDKIFTLNSKSKINRPDQPDRDYYERSSKAVGRIFVRFTLPDQIEPEWNYGTGFCVKNNIVVTAGHFFEYPDTTKSNIHCKIYIYFGYDATIRREIFLDDIDKIDGIYELEMLCGDVSFIMLKFKDVPPPNQEYLFPSIPTNYLVSNHFVIGHPNLMYFKQFFNDFNGIIENAGHTFIDIMTSTRGFQLKTIFKGHIVELDNYILFHDCPTLPGTSGGILSNSQFQRSFIGIHLGGSSKTRNVALSVTHPLFWHLYRKFVLDDQFIQENLQHLKPYLNHFNYTFKHSSLVEEQKRLEDKNTERELGKKYKGHKSILDQITEEPHQKLSHPTLLRPTKKKSLLKLDSELKGNKI